MVIITIIMAMITHHEESFTSKNAKMIQHQKIKVPYHTNRLKEKNYIIVAIQPEKALDKI